jgi:hypothetical protein
MFSFEIPFLALGRSKGRRDIVTDSKNIGRDILGGNPGTIDFP